MHDFHDSRRPRPDADDLDLLEIEEPRHDSTVVIRVELELAAFALPKSAAGCGASVSLVRFYVQGVWPFC
jgi:hypothetical protein